MITKISKLFVKDKKIHKLEKANTKATEFDTSNLPVLIAYVQTPLFHCPNVYIIVSVNLQILLPFVHIIVSDDQIALLYNSSEQLNIHNVWVNSFKSKQAKCEHKSVPNF